MSFSLASTDHLMGVLCGFNELELILLLRSNYAL